MVSLGVNFLSDELIIGIHLDLFGSVFYFSESSHHLVFSTKCAVLCLVSQSYPTLCDPMDCSPLGSSVYEDSPGKNAGMDWHALFQGIFPTQDQTQVPCIVGGFFTI